MFKKTVSIFFTVFFLGIVSAPSILVAIDDSIDVSILYSLCEEEESKNLKLVVTIEDEPISPLYKLLKMETLGYCFKTYLTPHLNLISPPPELHI